MKKIMIVDDNRLSAEGIEKNMDWAALDAEVIHVKYDGSSAAEALRLEPVDIIISDIEMPGLDGISMSRLALSLNPFIKIILISAYDKFEYAKNALRLGVYDYIEKPIDYAYLQEKAAGAAALIDKEKRNMELLRQSRPVMTEKFFSDLLHYPAQDARFHLASYPDYLELKLDYTHAAVMLFQLENTACLAKELGPSQVQMLLYSASDTAGERCKIFDRCHILREFDGFICVLLQNCSNPAHFSQSIHKTASCISGELQRSGITINIGIGNIVNDPWKLGNAYQSALRALEYRFFFPQKNIFDAREALGCNLSLEPFSDSLEEELIRLLCRKDKNALQTWLQAFSASILRQYRTKNLVFIRIYSLLVRILKFLYELNIDAEDIEERIIKAYSHTDTFSTNEQFFSWLTDICLTVCDKLDSSLQTYHDRLCESVLRYIQENYECSSLCLNDIARYANVSSAYLSALFKKNQKQSISDAISQARINAACGYLSNSVLSLKEISEKCGYSNQYYFSTSFKKRMGVSPSAYRERKD